MELTKVFSVSRNGYRQHVAAAKQQVRAKQIAVIAEIKNINNDRHLKVYGSPRMTSELNARGYDVSENTVAKLMRGNDVRAKRMHSFKPPKTTVVDKNAKFRPNLLKDQVSTRFGQHLIADITYIPTKEGTMYLSVVLDRFSRLNVGWELTGSMPAAIVVKSLENALKNWRIDTHSAMFHSDRGSQYTSDLASSWLETRGFERSMSGKGNCYDNANCESFFSSLKAEILPHCGYFQSKEEARREIYAYIESFYNTRRRHSSLGMLSPLQFFKLHEKILANSA